MLTANRTRALLAYDPTTGVFTWRDRRGRGAAGTTAGYVNKHGYRRIGIDGRTYAAHHIAWVHTYGSWPQLLDHRNGISDDDRIANLRRATTSQNAANQKRRRDNTSGFKGVSWHKAKGRWCARIGFRGQRKTIGYFDNPLVAHAAYAKAATETFGEFVRVE